MSNVLPDVPVRQWVLTAPSEVRRLLALKPEALTAQNRIFVEEIARCQKGKAQTRGIEAGETGSVTFVQRFNATLGAFRAPARPRARWRVRTPEGGRGRVARLPRRPSALARFGAGTKSPWAAEVNGINLHAGVMVRAGDREGLERRCRYGARPPFGLERMSLLPDGRVAYLLRKPRRNGATHLVLDPVHFLARIFALVPPPRYPLTRLAGVLAPHSTWRDAVVKYGRDETTAPPAPAAEKRGKKKKKKTDVSAAEARVPSGPRTSLGAAIVKPVGARIDWASLLRHVYLEDVLACPCGGRLRIIADVEEPSAIEAILSHLGLPTTAPPVAQARSPARAGEAA